ncbi:MAG: helix-turn-helix domain-containing protein, partial [Candidatus Latescibacterota bacterium]
MKPLHKELQDIRIEKGISLDDISRETKIRVPFLEKIEEGDFTVVPEPFIRAFLREYAETLGVSPDRVISKFEGKATAIRDEDFWKYNPAGPVTPATAPPSQPELNRRKTDHPAGAAKEKEKNKPAPLEPDVPKPSEPVSPPVYSDVVQAATKIISDSLETETVSEAVAPSGGQNLSS